MAEQITKDDMLRALSANIYSLAERLEIVEEYLVKQGFAFKETTALKTDRTRGFSQFGEDTWIKVNVKLPEKGFFIEVGVADGITNSNTYWLEKKGWDGLCFEPDPRNYAIAKLYRQNVLPYAVGAENGEMDFGIAAMSPDLSGLKNNLSGNETIKVKVVTLNEMLAERNVDKVDVLSVDVEGTEIDVLEGFDFEKYKPAVVVVEFLSPAQNNEVQLTEYMTKKGYKVAHKTYSNLICVPNS